MKTSVYIVQEATGLSYELSFDVAKDSTITAKQFVFGAMPKFFNYVYTMRSLGAKGVKLSEPFAVVVKQGKNVVFRSNNVDENQFVNEAFGAKLKLQNTWEGRKRFAERINVLLEYVEQKFGPITFDQLIDSIQED